MLAPAWRLALARRHLAKGGVIAYPTEAVYGLGCDPLNPWAVERVFALKGRSKTKGLILIAADWGQLAPYVSPPDSQLMAQVAAQWQGPTTWVLAAHPWVPQWLTAGRGTLAVRVTHHPLAAGLCRAWGAPLISTSANLSGGEPARSALEVRLRFGQGLDYLLSAPLGGYPEPSAIWDGVSAKRLR